MTQNILNISRKIICLIIIILCGIRHTRLYLTPPPSYLKLLHPVVLYIKLSVKLYFTLFGTINAFTLVLNVCFKYLKNIDQ
jgi:hypothetical protein